MTSTDSNEPTADEFDALLAESISTNRTAEQVRENAEMTAMYFTTLLDNGVDPHNATEITCLWLAHVMETDA